MLRRLVADLIRFAGRKDSVGRDAADAARIRGDWPQAAVAYDHYLVRVPGDAAARNDYGIVLCELGRLDLAKGQFETALSINPRIASAHLNLGHLCMKRQAYREAVSHYRGFLEMEPDHHDVRGQLALAHYELGEVETALECLAQISQSGLLEDEYSLFMTNALAGHDPRGHREAHLAWGAKLSAITTARKAPDSHSGRAGGGKIRIGYVSADFREHAVTRFLLPVLEWHDRSSFAIFCYANQSESDDITTSIRSMEVTWRNIGGLDDEQAAARVAADGIDILVDLSGHTRGNRLGVFVLKPAAIQVSWLGYLNTTGLKAIRYRISDSLMDPEGISDECHSETLVRLDPSGWSYRAPAGAPIPGPAPGDTNGYTTFGSFNHIAKLNDQVLDCWAAILERCPESRLNILGVPDPEAAGRLAGPFLKRGIAVKRLKMIPRLHRGDFMREMENVDIALDPFPYCGGATTCECLWMGLPVVSLAGDFGFARSSTAIVSQAGFPEFVVQSQKAYIGKALDLAVAGIAGYRATMRDTMRASVLMDEAGFVRRLETAFRGLLHQET